VIEDIQFRWAAISGWQVAMGSTPDLQYRVRRENGDWSDWLSVPIDGSDAASGLGKESK
jgi:hypothetical protein